MYDSTKNKKRDEDLIDDDVFNRALNLVKTNGNTGSLTAQKNAALNAYLNRDDFKYNVNNDALYQQYKDKYIQQGQQAMQDTMGQAAALTGGYGSSYAQNVGQQAYNSHLQQLNDVVPELYQMAYNRYQDKGAELLQRYGLLADEEREAYDRQHQKERDAVSDSQWQQSFDHQKERDAVSDSQWQQSFDHQKERDAVSDSQWQQGFDHQKERDAVSDSQWQQGFDHQKERDAVSDSQWERNFTENQRQFNQSYVLEALDQNKESEAETYTYTYTDPETNRVHYLTSDGKDVEFDKGINPNTGTSAANLEHGTFGNAGYQPSYIKIRDKEYELKDFGVHDGTQVYKAENGAFYVWNDSKNKYEEYEGIVPDNTEAIRDFKHTWYRRDNGDKDWNILTMSKEQKYEYIGDEIDRRLKDGRLTRNEAGVLMAYFGVE